MTVWPQQITRRQFEQYVATRDLDREFPGARGVGYIIRVPAQVAAAFTAAARTDGFPDFAIRELQPGLAQWYFEHATPTTEFFAPTCPARATCSRTILRMRMWTASPSGPDS